MKVTAIKDLDAIQGNALLRLDKVMRKRRLALDPGGGANDDVRAAKLAEALAVEAGFVISTPLLLVEADARDEEVVTVARSVLAKAQEASNRIAALEAERQRLQAAIRAAKSPVEIDGILTSIT